MVSLDSGYSATCNGDFSFTDGLLQNDLSISLAATGYLTIGANASLLAPMITLTADSIQIFGNVASTSPSTMLVADSKEIILSRIITQNNPERVLNWEQLQILPGREVDVGGDIVTSFNQTAPRPIITNDGGSILLSSNSGLINNSGTSGNALITLVPEPSAYMMMILGLIPLGFMSKRKSV
ncbi:MAG: PEP-CTERM sorting domain-containing protein [Pseudomonadota bacterium]